MTFLLLIIGVIVGSQLSQYFLDINYILKSFTLSAEFAIVALVLTMVIIAGEIDLSPASNMALSACLFAYAQQAGRPMPIAIGIGLASGLVMGLLNGLMVIGLQLPSIIVTIGTLTLYRGLAQVIAGDKSIRVPEWFVGIDNVLVFGVPVPVIVFVALSIVLGVVLGATIFGRQIYLVGTNEVAARHAGVRSKRIKMILFVVTGLDQRRRRTDDGLAARLGALRSRARRRIADGADGDAGRHLHLRRPRNDPRHLPRGLAAGYRHDRNDRRRLAAGLPALRSGRTADRLDHRHQSHLFPHRKVAGCRAGQPGENQGGRTC